MITENNPFIKTEEVVGWIENKAKEVEVVVEKTSFSNLEGWNFNGDFPLYTKKVLTAIKLRAFNK